MRDRPVNRNDEIEFVDERGGFGQILRARQAGVKVHRCLRQTRQQILRDIVRGRIGFDGVLVSDDLAMGAISGAPAERALACLDAGCDLAMWCPGDPATADVLAAVPPPTPQAAARLARSRGRLAGVSRRQDI